MNVKFAEGCRMYTLRKLRPARKIPHKKESRIPRRMLKKTYTAICVYVKIRRFNHAIEKCRL